MRNFISSLLIAVVLHQSLGEASYYHEPVRRYRILTSNDPYYYTDGYGYYRTNPYAYRTTYYNPYVNYANRLTPAVKYTSRPSYSPVRAEYTPSHDDKVYITDKYGRTTVTSDSAYYRNYVLAQTRYSAVAPQSTVCTSSTCGVNAQCSMVGGRPVCSCFRGYMGDPLHTCRRAECLDNSECRGHLTCKNEHCVDPCLDVCGTNAQCETRNHIPVCTCPAEYTGNPLSHCRRFDPSELCHPSPCGPNTQCEVINGNPTCKCLPGYHGSPIAGCRHECDSDAECGSNLACIDFKCQNPCLTQCGTNAECEGVRNNAAVCKCPRGYFGNAYSACTPECVTHSDCPRNKPACFYNSCKNPCDGVCGIGANCELRDITPVCSCPKDMTGDPFVRCRPFEKRDLCEPNPCGANAHCEPGYDKYNEERPVCTCLPGYQGDPLRGCVRGECTEDAHCPDHQACVDYHCQNPCIGQCGSSADCMARRHIAVCTCPPGYNGDALTNCYQVSGTAVTRRYYRQILAAEAAEIAANATIPAVENGAPEVVMMVQPIDGTELPEGANVVLKAVEKEVDEVKKEEKVKDEEVKAEVKVDETKSKTNETKKSE